jgi:hypothetical protein
MNLPERDGDGYLTDMGEWTDEIGRAMAEADGYELDDVKWSHIIKARAYYEEFGSVPPIRKFCQVHRRRPERRLQIVDDRADEADHQIRWVTKTDWLRLRFERLVIEYAVK